MQEHFSVKLVMTDDVGHLAMEPGTESYQDIINIFGADIKNFDETINRTKLGQIVSCNKEKSTSSIFGVYPNLSNILLLEIKEMIF